jgi:demethylmenaquinone methyltransferase/2-methoxy-6-polyprenyl-1,4-benzoquinol methylase
MANKFYREGRERASSVDDLFSAIAPRYDLVNDLQSLGLHRLWKQRLMRLAKASAASHVLDLCCGTGDVACRFAERGARVVGLDFNEEMLAVARKRQTVQHPVNYLRGDALHLPFGDGHFDIVSVSYGLRNLADIEGGLREMYRVAKPGGRLLVLDFGKPQRPLLRNVYFAYLEHCVPVFGRVFWGDAALYGYIVESLRHYPAQEGVAALMRKLNCRGVRVHNLLGGMMSINYGEK